MKISRFSRFFVRKFAKLEDEFLPEPEVIILDPIGAIYLSLTAILTAV